MEISTELRQHLLYHSTSADEKPSEVFTCMLTDDFQIEINSWCAKVWGAIKGSPASMYKVDFLPHLVGVFPVQIENKVITFRADALLDLEIITEKTWGFHRLRPGYVQEHSTLDLSDRSLLQRAKDRVFVGIPMNMKSLDFSNRKTLNFTTVGEP